MKVLFRTDASSTIGAGHVVRCRALARALQARGADIRFMCRKGPGDFIDTLRSDGFDVVAVEQIDAPLAEKADWLVVDHYGLDATWETAARTFAERILVIDDVADRGHDCDMLLDQNFSAAPETRYSGLVKPGCRMLLGPRYALLAEGYAHARASLKPFHETPQRVLVSFGGADAGDMTGKAVAALAHDDCSSLQIDVVAGAAYAYRAALMAAAGEWPNIKVHGPQPSLLPLMAAADLAIGAGGTTTWERCCLALPSVVVTIADNQVPSTAALAAEGVILSLGPQEGVMPEHIRAAARTLLASPDKRLQMAEAGRRLVDGRGVQRVAEAMSPTPDAGLALRPATPEDSDFLYFLANEQGVRRQSFTTDPIPWAGHQKWVAARLGDPACRIMVAEARGLPVGQIRFDRRDGADGVFVNYALDPAVHGRGWGAQMVARGTGQMLREGAGPVRAEVKPENAASLLIFDRLGFAREATAADKISYVLRDGVDLLPPPAHK